MKPLSEREKEEDEAEFDKNVKRLKAFLLRHSFRIAQRIKARLPWRESEYSTWNRFRLLITIGSSLYHLGHLALPALSILGVDILFKQVQLYWQQTPLLFESVSSRISCSFIILILGFLLYLLRENYRFFYASLELGAGAVTAYNAVARLFANHDTGSAMVTLLGAMYIVVRSFDNYSKHYEAKKKRLS